MPSSGVATGWLGNPDTAGGRFVAAYTHQFGNGISGTLSLEDNKERKRGNYNGANALTSVLGAGVQGTTPGIDTRGGNTWPEIVGQLRIDQAWGGFHLAGQRASTTTSPTIAAGVGHDDGCWPAAAPNSPATRPTRSAAASTRRFRFNVPTGVNDALYIGGTWSKGAPRTCSPTSARARRSSIYGGSNSPVTYGSITGTALFDSVYTTTARTGAGITVGPVGQQLTTAYGGSIAFEHGWNAEWRTSVFGGVQVVDYNDTANAILCSRFAGILTNAAGASVHNTTACNWDYRVVGAGTRTFWTPVRDLTHRSSSSCGRTTMSAMATVSSSTSRPSSGFKPNARYEVRDQNVFSGTVLGSPLLLIGASLKLKRHHPRQGNLPGISFALRGIAQQSGAAQFAPCPGCQD